MNLVKQWIRNFFGFSRRETNGFIILLPLLALIIFSEPVYRFFITHKKQDFIRDKSILDSLIVQWDNEKALKDSSSIKAIKAQPLFHFDPNSTRLAEFNSLGFPAKLSSRILHYREKGGKFRNKEDLLKIYGMDTSLYKRLYHYIKIAESPQKVASAPSKKYIRETVGTHVSNRFDINAADTAQLKRIYGIGAVLAARIVKYRDGLGGFITIHQLAEVYGLDSAVVDKLVKASFLMDNFMPKQININTATEKDLDAHPYISKAIAKGIVAYRFQHGNFTKVSDIKVCVKDPDLAEKIIPYLKVND